MKAFDSAAIRWAAVGFALCATLPLVAATPEDKLNAAFAEADAEGTFVVLDPIQDRIFQHNAGRAQQRFVPASSFKIVNTLIGLHTGTVESVDIILPYGGESQPFPEWEKDMSLRDAIKVSNVPVYQELARRTGMKRMKAALTDFDYGNAETGKTVDRFWLDGPLKISAVEQVDFIRRMLNGDLGVSADCLEAIQDITLLEKTPEYELHGKTGWNSNRPPGIGWFVGWVKKGDAIYPFALNMDLAEADRLPIRISLSKKCLQALGIL